MFAELDGFPLYTADDLAYLIGASLLLAFTKSDTGTELRAIGEKTPDNVRHFEVLHAIFPAAKFLNVVRDGRDCAISGWFHNLRTNPDWIRAKYPSLSAYATMFAREWANDIAHADCFAAAHPLACLTVRYEALLAGTAPVLREVLDFLGVASRAETVAQCCDAAAFEHLSAGRARGEENREVVLPQWHARQLARAPGRRRQPRVHRRRRAVAAALRLSVTASWLRFVNRGRLKPDARKTDRPRRHRSPPPCHGRRRPATHGFSSCRAAKPWVAGLRRP